MCCIVNKGKPDGRSAILLTLLAGVSCGDSEGQPVRTVAPASATVPPPQTTAVISVTPEPSAQASVRTRPCVSEATLYRTG
jgi:hypothetical protein